ncbi:MAG: CoA-binding protein [Bacteroidetes bacterium]|nr:MAG: CoA-binding protein [Bacteroidota bacterium]
MNKMTNKVTLVVGASINEIRYSNMAVKLLTNYGHSVYAYAVKIGKIDNIEIMTQWPANGSIDTVTMYVGVQRQFDLYDKIIELKPRRIIFNPGTENTELANILISENIEVVINCSLVMLRGGIY